MNASTLQNVCSAEWAPMGRDSYKLARYWVKRVCAAYGVRPDADMAADCVAIAYGRYMTWRGKHTPDDAGKKIQSLIRASARRAVTQGWENRPKTVADELALAAAAASEDVDAAGIVALLLKLPPHLLLAAARLAFYDHDNLRELGSDLDCSAATVVNRMRELRRHPAIVALARERGLRTLAELASDCAAAVN